MAKVRAKRGGSVLCAIEVPEDEISAYGVFDVETVPDAANQMCCASGHGGESRRGRAVAVRRGQQYILDRAIFDALRRVQGVGGEIQLTDAIALLIEDGHRTCGGAPRGPDTTWEIPATTLKHG